MDIFGGSCSAFLFDFFFGPGVKHRINPREGIFPRRNKLYILSLKLAGFAGSGVKIGYGQRYGILTHGAKIVIFSGSCSTFLFNSLKPGVQFRMNPRDGIFPKRNKLNFSCLKLVAFVGSGVKIRFNLRGGISTQGPKFHIFSGSCTSFLIDFFWTWGHN